MLFVGGYEKAYPLWWQDKREILWHSFLEVTDTDGNLIKRKMVAYEPGADFSEDNYHETDYLSTNLATTTNLIVLKNGDIMIPLSVPNEIGCRLAGQDYHKIFPSAPYTTHCIIVCRGVWNSAACDYDLTFSKPIIVDDRISSRGCDEPMLAELDSGKILMIFRMSNYPYAEWNSRISPYTPGYKLFCLSDDGGETFTPPMPWYFNTREVLYSSCSLGDFLRDENTGRLYWIGNVTDPTKNLENFPRYPLCIVEIDREWGCAMKETLTIIDTRSEGEPDVVQFSNWAKLQDRETGKVELYLTKIGQYEGAKNWWKADSMRYIITLPR